MHGLVLRPTETPGRDDERCEHRDPEEREHRHARLAHRPVTPWCRRSARANDDLLVSDGEARAVLVDERLSVETERLRVGAEEALHVRGRGQDVEPLVLERAQVFRPDLRARFELGKVELLAESRLAEAGADVEHERASVEDMS